MTSTLRVKLILLVHSMRNTLLVLRIQSILEVLIYTCSAHDVKSSVHRAVITLTWDTERLLSANKWINALCEGIGVYIGDVQYVVIRACTCRDIVSHWTVPGKEMAGLVIIQ